MRFDAFDLSLEIVISGPRGAGKTLLETGLGSEALCRADVVKNMRIANNKPDYRPRHKMEVFCNHPIAITFGPSFYKHPVDLKSKELDIDALMVWDKQFKDCWIIFDEIDQVADRQDWYNTVAKFLTAGVQLIRHRNVSLLMTIQDIEWLNSRLQWQADILINCRDLAFTPWGREHNLGLGEVTNTTWIDKSGMMTGYTFAESGKVYSMQFFGKRYHNAYSTLHDVDVIENKIKRRILLPERVIDMQTDAGARDTDQEALKAAVEYFYYSKNEKVRIDDLWAKAIKYGFNGELKHYRQYLLTLGVTSERDYKGLFYKLENVKPEIEI